MGDAHRPRLAVTRRPRGDRLAAGSCGVRGARLERVHAWLDRQPPLEPSLEHAPLRRSLFVQLDQHRMGRPAPNVRLSAWIPSCLSKGTRVPARHWIPGPGRRARGGSMQADRWDIEAARRHFVFRAIAQPGRLTRDGTTRAAPVEHAPGQSRRHRRPGGGRGPLRRASTPGPCPPGTRCARWAFKPDEGVKESDDHDCPSGQEFNEPFGTTTTRCKRSAPGSRADLTSRGKRGMR